MIIPDGIFLQQLTVARLHALQVISLLICKPVIVHTSCNKNAYIKNDQRKSQNPPALHAHTHKAKKLAVAFNTTLNADECWLYYTQTPIHAS